jgi:FAD/FMN-containing dehydrogenase
LVEGFEVVLPSGEIIQVGSMAYVDTPFGPYHRHITGPDLVGLFTKANGAFGIVTKIAYRCLHKPQHWAYHAYQWPAENIEGITKAIMEATALEMFDVHFIDKWALEGPAFGEEEQNMLPKDCAFVLIVTMNAENTQDLNIKEKIIEDVCKTHGGTYLPDFGEDFHARWPTWYNVIAHMVPPPSKITKKIPRVSVYTFDEIIHPSSMLPAIYNKLMEICKKYGFWEIPQHATFIGFVSAGQIISSQPGVCIDDSDPSSLERFHKCQDEFRKWFGEMGGTFQYRLPPLVPDYAWTNQMGTFNLLKNIKALLDPNNILSPGTFTLGDK